MREEKGKKGAREGEKRKRVGGLLVINKSRDDDA